MTGPQFQPQGYVQMPGGYQPQAPVGQPAQVPLPPGLQQPVAQPQQPQPTLPWSPPGPFGAPIEGAPPPQRVAPQPAYVPQPTQQPQNAQPFVQPQMQPQAPAPQAQPQLDPNTRLSGPGVPTELQGKTLAEAMNTYNGMRQVVLRAVQGQQPGQPAQPAQPQQPAAQPQQPGQLGQDWDWRNPQAGIAKVVAEQLAPLQQALQPVVLQTQLASVKSARDTVAAEVGPQFAAVESQVLESLRGADPQQLMNPEMWRIATQRAVGMLAIQGRLPQQAPTGPAQQPAYNQWLQPAQRLQPGQQPVPNLSGFFTEQPASGMPVGGQGGQLTANQAWAAQAMGMSPQDYAAWSAGVPSGGVR